MAIKKFNSFQEASKDLWVIKPDKEYYEKLKQLFAFWNELYEKKCIKGIQKFKSYNELQKFN